MTEQNLPHQVCYHEPMKALLSTTKSDLLTIESMLTFFGVRGWIGFILGTIGALILIGIPSELINNPIFSRVVPPRSYDYVIWVLSALLMGLIAGSFTMTVAKAKDGGKVLSGGFLSFLAVGCPVCNKLVVLFLGTSGALSIFAPMQIYIGIASLLLLTWTLVLRARSVAGTCAIPPQATVRRQQDPSR